MLSRRSQVARLRRLAREALAAYPLADPELRFIAHDENTTFRVDARAPSGRERFLLRVHRPARHGRNVDPAAAVGSELCWLTALRADTGLLVPEPFRTAEGSLTTMATSRQVPQPRVCSVLRWMEGRICASAPRPAVPQVSGQFRRCPRARQGGVLAWFLWTSLWVTCAKWRQSCAHARKSWGFPARARTCNEDATCVNAFQTPVHKGKIKLST